jgi:transposase-like protein
MKQSVSLYKRHRFPPVIIQHAVWLYHRFNLSHRDIEDLLAERGIEVSYESVRLWCNKFGPLFSKRLKRKHPGFGDTFFIDEVFVNITRKGTVKLTRIAQPSPDEAISQSLQTTPISAGHHSTCCLALPPVQSQSPRHRRLAR